MSDSPTQIGRESTNSTLRRSSRSTSHSRDESGDERHEGREPLEAAAPHPPLNWEHYVRSRLHDFQRR